jgi:hypothetical protein
MSPPSTSQNIDIGGGVFISPVVTRGKVRGLIEQHVDPFGFACMAYLKLNRPDDSNLAPHPGYDVVCEEPLTLLPMIVCSTCGKRGFITKGKWVPA